MSATTLSEVEAEMAALLAEGDINDRPWVDPATLPPTDLPSDDGEPMESPWHAGSGSLLKAAYVAARGGVMTDYYVGVNMFVYYSWKQVRNLDFKGPDMFFANDVEGQKPRLYWAIWDEDGRYPDMVIEFLSASTEREDLETKRKIYEERFRLREYICIAPQCERLLGWRANGKGYLPIATDERGWIWSEYLGFWIGPWQGFINGETQTWPRLYHPNGQLALLPHESEKQRADEEKQRADALAERLAELEAELARLRGQG
jgi:Uma2 family endonuclease